MPYQKGNEVGERHVPRQHRLELPNDDSRSEKAEEKEAQPTEARADQRSDRLVLHETGRREAWALGNDAHDSVSTGVMWTDVGQHSTLDVHRTVVVFAQDSLEPENDTHTYLPLPQGLGRTLFSMGYFDEKHLANLPSNH